MIHYIAINSEGEIISTLTCPSSVSYGDNVEINGMLHLQVDKETFDIPDLMENYFYRNQEIRPRDPRPSPFHFWEDYTWVFNNDALFAEMRNRRDERLKRCDWTQVGDCPLTDEKKTEWRTYRQALRDVPANNDHISNINQVNWPTEPS